MDPQDAAKLLDQLAPSAAKEQAGQAINQFLVTTSTAQQAFPETPAGASTGGNAAPTPIPDDAALDAAQWAQESRGQHTDASGRLTTSPAGARGISQVMPGTGVDPGYGVKPLQNNSREEYIRFGKDYRKALLNKYDGNIVLALTAYNWGPGNVDEHIARVGDPRKGQISDAGFLNSIQVKEAREYATLVLGRTGVNPSGSQTMGTAAAQSPTYSGEEINLAATFAKIDAADLTFMQKDALKAEASRIHSLGRQAKAEAEDRLKDAVWTQINTMEPGSFTSYDQLPLQLRNQLSAYPTLEASIRNQAQTNEAQRLARIEAADKDKKTAEAQQAEEDLLELAFANPDEFLRTDIRTFPGLTHDDRMTLMSRQQQIRESREKPGAQGTVDHDRLRKAISRYAPTVKLDGKDKASLARMGRALDAAIIEAQNQVKANGGKPLTDTQVDGIARQIMMPVNISVNWGRDLVVPRFEGRERIRELGKRYSGDKSSLYDVIRADIQRKENRVPSDEEVIQKARMYQQATMGGGS
jgi:hypothetical protein